MDNSHAPSGAEKKGMLLASGTKVQQAIQNLHYTLQSVAPNARQLVVMKEVEKLQRQQERVQMGLQELVL
jgi:hypothetical protein